MSGTASSAAIGCHLRKMEEKVVEETLMVLEKSILPAWHALTDSNKLEYPSTCCSSKNASPD